MYIPSSLIDCCDELTDMDIGLSLLFFILSLMGNLTYGAGVSLTFTPRDSHKPD